MKGFVPTPEGAVDLMVTALFRYGPPKATDRVLDPGSGEGAFVDGIIRFCAARELPLPRITAVELNPEHCAFLRSRFEGNEAVTIEHRDFLTGSFESFDFIIGNPPYVSIGALSEAERAEYRRAFTAASGRFDLYLLFFERALQLLKPRGRLVFITPEKYLYVNTAQPLRRLLASRRVAELQLFPEDTFANRITYPLVTVIDAEAPSAECLVTERDGTVHVITGRFPETSWQPLIRRAKGDGRGVVLAEVMQRISCGVATGADAIFVMEKDRLPSALQQFAHPTLSGRDIKGKAFPPSRHVMLLPYDREGSLIPEEKLGALKAYLGQQERRQRLEARTCVRSKPWYAFHETPPLPQMLQPKILCKDIGAEPLFIVDREGSVVPRHSVYYLIPHDPSTLDELAAYLNSGEAAAWLRNNCQRAANGFIRLQSHVLKKLPVPAELCSAPEQPGFFDVERPLRRTA